MSDLPESFTAGNFAAWDQNLKDSIDTLDKLISALDTNPLLRMVLKASGTLTTLDQAKAVLDALNAALHKLP